MPAVRYSFLSSTSWSGGSFSEKGEKDWMSLKYGVVSAPWPPSCGSAHDSTIASHSCGHT